VIEGTRHYITSYCGDLMVLTALFKDELVAHHLPNYKFRTFMFRPESYFTHLEGSKDGKQNPIAEATSQQYGRE